MRIKMKVTSAGPDGVLNEGKIYDVVDKKGRQLVDGGYATEERAQPPPETAEAPPEVPEEAPADTTVPEPEVATVTAPETAEAPPARRSPAKPRGARKG